MTPSAVIDARRALDAHHSEVVQMHVDDALRYERMGLRVECGISIARAEHESRLIEGYALRRDTRALISELRRRVVGADVVRAMGGRS